MVEAAPHDPQTVDPLLKQQFLVRVAELLHRHGTPSHRLERVMTKVSRTLQEPGTFLYTPTALLVSFGEGTLERTYLRRVDSGSIDAEKLLQFDEALEALEAGEINLRQAKAEIERVAASKPPFAWWMTVLAYACACAAMAVLFRGNDWEIAIAGGIGLLMAALEVVHQKLGWENGLLFPLSGFLAASCTLGLSHLVPIDDRLVTLASLIVLLPGFPLTVSLTELAVGHLSSGVARLAGAVVILLTMFAGVAIAWRLLGAYRIVAEPTLPVHEWLSYLAIGIAPACFAVLFRVRWSLWPMVFAVCLAGYFSSAWMGQQNGVEAAAFFGALAVGCLSNLYARLYDRPAMIVLAPGMIMLVPGSLGYRALAALQEKQTMEGIEIAFGTLLVAVSLVGGTLAASAIVPPKRIL